MKIRLDEGMLKNLISEAITDMLTESIKNDELRKVISMHGGIKNDIFKKYLEFPLEVAQYEGDFIDKDVWERLPISAQGKLVGCSVACNDGCHLMLSSSSDVDDIISYNDKVRGRGQDFQLDKFYGDVYGSDRPSSGHYSYLEKGKSQAERMKGYDSVKNVNPAFTPSERREEGEKARGNKKERGKK